jgi:hypothetical protein
LAQTALALAGISRKHSDARACCRLEIMCVSYWEWAKLIALSMVMSMVITAATGASVWLIMK